MQVRTKIMYLQTWLGVIRARYQRSPYHIQVQRHAVQLVLIIVLGLIILGDDIFLTIFLCQVHLAIKL